MNKSLFLATLSLLGTCGLISPAMAQDKPSTVKDTKSSGPIELHSVGQSTLASYADQTVKASGIIGGYINGNKNRYRFRMDDDSAVTVVGPFPEQGGGSRYDLTARVSRGANGLELQELSKAAAGSGGGIGKVDPLLLGGGLLLLAAAGTLVAMSVRGKNAERERRHQEEIEAARAREEEARRDAERQRQMAGATERGSTQVSGAAAEKPRAGTLVSVGRVVVLSGPQEGQTFPLLDHRTPIGRDADGGVKLDKDPSVSGLHAEILITPDRRVFFEDKSRNGSIVEGQMLNGSRTELSGPFEFSVGASRLRAETYFSPSTPASTAPNVAPATELPNDDRIIVGAIPDEGPRRAPTMVVDARALQPAAPTGIGFAAEFEQTGGIGDGRHHSLKGTQTTIGREDCDITLEDLSVSRRHATLEVRDGRFYILDAGSTHGTSVNGTRIGSESYELRDGDEVTFGNSPERLRFRSLLG